MTQHSFYGDNIRFFFADVLSTNDPHERGRVQIRIHGIHSSDPTDINNNDYPWAEVMLPSTEGGVSGIGKIPQIVESAFVFGMFLDGQASQTPIVLGTVSHMEGPTPGQVKANVEARNRGDFIPGNVGPNGTVVSENLRATYANATDLAAKRFVIMKFLLSQKRDDKPLFTPRQAAGIVGNMEGENGQFDPEANNGGTEERPENSWGLCQWNFNAGRGQNLQKFADSIGENWLDFFTQLKFLIHELTGKNTNNDGGSTYASCYDLLKKSTKFDGYPNNGNYKSVNATWIFLDKFENPHNKVGKIAEREKFARRAYMEYYDTIGNAMPQISQTTDNAR